MLADYHMHSHFSNDSQYDLEQLIQMAIRQGLQEICMTEHSDYGTMGDYVVDYDRYCETYLKLSEKYKNQITIKFGCEFGVQKHTIQSYKNDFNKYPFDFIILSNHQIDDKEFWTQEYQKGKTQAEYNQGYYEAIYDVIKHFDNYSVLGHLDMIKRYDEAGAYPDEQVKEIITKILKHVIEHEKGIEVNTSCFRYGLDDLTPSIYILKLYKDLGGTIITIGSDTHEESHVGCKIQYVQDELKKLGFENFCTFEKMEPIFHKL